MESILRTNNQATGEYRALLNLVVRPRPSLSMVTWCDEPRCNSCLWIRRDDLPSTHMKKVLTRIDAQNYLHNLEQEVVAAKGADFLKAMRSDGNYEHLKMFS